MQFPVVRKLAYYILLAFFLTSEIALVMRIYVALKGVTMKAKEYVWIIMEFDGVAPDSLIMSEFEKVYRNKENEEAISEIKEVYESIYRLVSKDVPVSDSQLVNVRRVFTYLRQFVSTCYLFAIPKNEYKVV